MNEQYIKKLEDTNKALEAENKRLEEALVAYNILKRHVAATLNACRQMIYSSYKDSPKRNEKTDRDFKEALTTLQKEVVDNKPLDIEPFDTTTYGDIMKHIRDTEKKALEVFKKSV
jgi:hypothetical protein